MFNPAFNQTLQGLILKFATALELNPCGFWKGIAKPGNL
jgi:hypothetical protein